MKKKRVSTASSAVNSLTGEKDHFSTPGRRGYFHTGDFIPAFGGKGRGDQSVLASAVSQVTLIQSNQMPKWHVLGWPSLSPTAFHLPAAGLTFQQLPLPPLVLHSSSVAPNFSKYADTF